MRNLARAGIPVYCGSEGLGFITRSRWYRVPPTGTVSDPSKLQKYLENLPFERCVLIACADNWISAVTTLPDSLSKRFVSCQPPMDTLRLLLDKGDFAMTLRENDIPHPETLLLESEEQIKALDPKMFGGSFLKPRNSHAFFKRYGVKACRVKSREDAANQYGKISRDGLTVLFQEYIPGPASNHYFIDGFVDRTGQVTAIFARRRLRMFPEDFGNSSYMVSVACDDISSVVGNIKRLLSAISYRGIFSAEFKYDERDRKYKIIEVNARPWWFVEFTASCGVNVCTMAYRDALGLNVQPVNGYRVGAKFIHPYYDVHICMQYLRSGKISLPAWIKSWIGADSPVFCLDDPMPALTWFAKGIFRKLKRALGVKI